MKTFYSVDYAMWGRDGLQSKWFDNLEDAKAFARRDYTDDVVVHNYKSQKKIQEVEQLICEQNYPWF